MVTQVLHILIPLQDKDDKKCWAPSTNGSFRVKKAYHIDQYRKFTIETPLQKDWKVSNTKISGTKKIMYAMSRKVRDTGACFLSNALLQKLFGQTLDGH